METRNSAIVVGLYLVGALLVVTVGLIYYRRESPDNQIASQLEFANASIAANQPAKHVSARPIIPPSPDVSSNIRELESSLKLTRDILEKRTAALNQKSAECKKLKAELEESFNLLLSLMGQELQSQPSDRQPAKEGRTKIDAELERLREAVEQSELLGAEQEQQLAQLQEYLVQADMELTAIQQQSKREVDELIAERQLLDETTIDLVAGFGIAAVPDLVGLLSHERREVRRWAVQALGEIGPEAQVAAGAVRDLTNDPEPSVRAQAEKALARIMGDI